MIPNWGISFSPYSARLQESSLLCGRSQMIPDYCASLKNLAFAVEPAANPIRPTLRDGH
jgi:hypothetical protein